MPCGLMLWFMLVPHLLWLAIAFKPAFLFELEAFAPVAPQPPAQELHRRCPRNNHPRPPPALSF